MEEFSWLELFYRSVGPIVGAVFGTLIIGTWATRITRKAQERRADHQLRLELIGQMTEAASSLYMATQNFWRKKDREKVSDAELAGHRLELDRQYHASRVAGEMLERRLEAYFSSDGCRALWHAITDLMTVRYFHLIGMATDELRRINAGEGHSGLSASELLDQKLLLQTYRTKLGESARSVLTAPLRITAG